MKKSRSYLTDEQEAVITMRFSELSHKEIAEIMGKSIAAIKKIEGRAWSNYKRSHATLSHWDLIVASGESMKKISESHERHSLADVMI